MKNKLFLKKILWILGILIILYLIISLIIAKKIYQKMNQNYNYQINSMVSMVIEKYPLIKKNDLMEIINNSSKRMVLQEYGIDLAKDSVILNNQKLMKEYYFILIIIGLLFSILMIIVFLVYQKRKDHQLKEISHYLENLYQGKLSYDLDSLSEDELSILKNDIYKITVMLKEMKEKEEKDKKSLKVSLEDISHQIKTPLTSILLMIDNLLDNPQMDLQTRNEFISDIKKEVFKINVLVQNLLKLSKFDSNTITFHQKKVRLLKIIMMACDNVSFLSDLRNVEINVEGDDKIEILLDEMWEVEAITNILKNSLEASKENDMIKIKYEQNKLYTKIMIMDKGKGIDSVDLPHVFERFYKGKNASKDSIGIGLALSKTIINKDNGTIDVESDCDGTRFIIKYF